MLDQTINFERIERLLPDIIARFDRQLRHLYVNNAIEAVTGIPARDFIGKTNEELGMPAPNCAMWTEGMRQVFDTGRQASFEFEFHGPQGTSFFELNIYPDTYAGDGSVATIVGYARNITERKRLEKAVQESEHRFRAAIAGSPIIVFNQDRDLRYTWVYNATPGIDPADLIGKRDVDVMERPEDAAVIDAIKNRVMETGKGERCEVGIHFCGRRLIYDLNVEPWRDASGSILGITCACTDITSIRKTEQDLVEARLAESALKEAKTLAEMESQFKSTFISNISHEIRTPLSSIRGFAQLLAKFGAETPRAQGWIESILRSSQQLEGIVNDILDLSKVEAGKVEMERGEVALGAILAEMNEQFALEAARKDIALRFVMDGQVPETITTDALRLKQILLNIIGNAMKFTEHGDVCVTTTMLRSDGVGPSSQLAFSVRDSGIGIQADLQKNLFQPFTQADRSITRKFGGTGLGLALSRRLAELLGGTVTLERSEPGHGSSFLITIDPHPIRLTAQPVPRGAAVDRAAYGRSGRDPESLLRGLSVLLVDDAPDIRVLVSFILETSGCAVHMATNGEECLSMLETQRFDIIIMDLQMPVLDGFEATRRIRARDPHLPIFALTAHAMRGEREKCLASGFTDYLTKPFDIQGLLDVIVQAQEKGVVQARVMERPDAVIY